MAKKREDLYYIEITDVIEPEQEDRVIEIVSSLLNKSYEELKEYFQTTDTIEVRRVSKETAESIAEKLNNIDVKIKITSLDEKKDKSKTAQIKCPRCGYVLEYPDWRCPECYYEFPDYEFVGDDESDDEIIEGDTE